MLQRLSVATAQVKGDNAFENQTIWIKQIIKH